MPVKNPYISINRLAEYATTSSSLRRRNIIKNLKEDKEFIAQRYSEVYNIMSPYFKSNCEENFFDPTIAKINAKTITSKWDKDDFRNSILALESLNQIAYPDFSNYDVLSTLTPKLDSISWNGVKVSIKPDVYLKHKKTNKVGAVKLNISKTTDSRLDDERREYVTAAMKYVFLDKGLVLAEIDNKACISLEAFGKEYSIAPAAYVNKIRHLQVSCQEIADRWDSV